jgi:hypothetical protein
MGFPRRVGTRCFADLSLTEIDATAARTSSRRRRVYPVSRLMSATGQTNRQFLLKYLPKTQIHGLIFMDANAMQFHRRENDDGSIDSICLRCFLTVKPRPALDLESAERDHSDHCTWIVTMDMLSEYPEPISRESA